MKEKLTLSIDKRVKERAKKAAFEKGKSVSQLVEEYLGELSISQPDDDIPTDSIVSKLSGSVQTPSTDYKTALTEALEKKYNDA